MKKQHLVLAGGGHAHMVTMAGISEIQSLGHRVTVIGPSDYHYYSGMGPGMLGSGYAPEDIRFTVRQTVESQGATYIRDRVTGVDPANRLLHLESGTTLSYDVLSFNTGSHVALPPISGNADQIFTVKPIERLYQAQLEIVSLAQKKKLRLP